MTYALCSVCGATPGIIGLYLVAKLIPFKYMNVGCDGFQIRNAGIHWFQSRKLRGVLCTNAGYLMKRKTHFGYFHDLRIIRRADYRVEITVDIR